MFCQDERERLVTEVAHEMMTSYDYSDSAGAIDIMQRASLWSSPLMSVRTLVLDHSGEYPLVQMFSGTLERIDIHCRTSADRHAHLAPVTCPVSD